VENLELAVRHLLKLDGDLRMKCSGYIYVNIFGPLFEELRQHLRSYQLVEFRSRSSAFSNASVSWHILCILSDFTLSDRLGCALLEVLLNGKDNGTIENYRVFNILSRSYSIASLYLEVITLPYIQIPPQQTFGPRWRYRAWSRNQGF